MNVKGNREQNFYSWIGVIFGVGAILGITTEVAAVCVGSFLTENPGVNFDHVVYGGAVAGLIGLLVSGLAQSKLDKLQGR
jgi:hypothetical protein